MNPVAELPNKLIAQNFKRARQRRFSELSRLARLAYVDYYYLNKKENAMRQFNLADIWHFSDLFVTLPESATRNLSEYEVRRQKFLIFCASLTQEEDKKKTD